LEEDEAQRLKYDFMSVRLELERLFEQHGRP
jgi:hypothetical protein